MCGYGCPCESLADAVERIWEGITPETAPSDEEAARIIAEELALVRRFNAGCC